MSEKTVRTRYAPSPTGFMHVGNLRTALYEYLVAKSQGGRFILRIEDTDRERLVDGAVDFIYNTLKLAGLQHDEGPDVGGEFGPYVQSERKDMYLPYAEQLIKEGKAYRCFCTKERLEKLQNETVGGGYDRPVRLARIVRGMGVAESVSTSTPLLISLSFSLWETPNRCSSSTTSRPRSLNSTLFCSRAWVPMSRSTLPARSFCRISRRWAGELYRLRRAISTG